MASIATSIQLYDRVTQPLNTIVNALNSTVNAFAAVDTAMGGGMPTEAIENARSAVEKATADVNQLQQAVQEVNSTSISPNVEVSPVEIPIDPVVNKAEMPNIEPITVPVNWETDSMDIFTNTGVDRFQQEIQSANSMINDLVVNQNKINQTASKMKILPKGAINDFNNLSQRISGIQNELSSLENIPVSMRTDTVNNQIEYLRNKISSATANQEELNQAMQNMNVKDVNAAYSKLSSSIGDTERYIRDNKIEQQNFNNEISNGISRQNELVSTIKRAAAVLISVTGIKKAFDLSDEITMTKARLDLMNQSFNEINGSAYKTKDLMNAVYMSAQDARGSFGDMAAIVAKFGNNAKDAFSNQAEVVDFANLVQKQMTIAGASTTEASNAMLQLSQALGSGVLRGDELNSIFDQAPNLIQSIADYMDVPIGQIRKMAGEGQITADIVKQAMFASADDINAKFDAMPMTWGQVWTNMSNAAVKRMQPVLDKINELANNDQFQVFAEKAVGALASISIILLSIMELAGNIAAFISENWSIIEPIVWGIVGAMSAYLLVMGIASAINGIMAFMEGVKATATFISATATAIATGAQYGLNAALAACPLTWIIALILILIAVVYAVCAAIAKMTGVATSGFGVICGCVTVVISFFKNLGLSVANICVAIGSAIGALCSNMMTAFHNAICNVQSWFYNLLSTACSVIDGICAALNKLPFVEFDYSGITNAADEYAAKAAKAAGNKEDYKSVSGAFSKGMNTFDTFQSGWASKAFKSGASWGDGVVDKMKGFNIGDKVKLPKERNNPPSVPSAPSAGGYDAGNVPSNIANTAGNTGKMADTLKVSEEELKYLRDIAERDAINRFTTAEIKVDFGGITNNVENDTDLDGIVDYIASGVKEAMEVAAEGVHV